ncbi:MAG TPA: aminotransferase class V-fold PLP-dependent enzyme [Thermoplasmata archaeon]|nr:aminotransferase class V-fold PLP-dependent enzyme [Thermoplasmata archaeon]
MSLAGIRGHFPALRSRPGTVVPAYLDSACMSLVPNEVIRAMESYYRDYPGCAGRSLHRFAEEVSHRFEAARDAFAKFLGAPDRDAVVFVRNATEALNLVGQGIDWKSGDRVLVTDQEHNSNLVLWQRLGRERGIRLETLALSDDGAFDGDALEAKLAQGIRLVSMFHTSNLDGRSLPVAEIVERAHARGAEVLLDGCQAAPHASVDLARLGVDYYALSAHKMLGPTGMGVLAARRASIDRLRPLLLGGETVEWSTLEDHALRPSPHRFEAGLQNYAGVIGAHAAIDFLGRAGRDEIRSHDLALNQRVTRALADEPRVHLLGPADPHARPSIFAFHVDGVDPHDGALFLDTGHGVLVRSGMNCVHSWYRRHGLPGNLRASFYLYNSTRDADRLVSGVRELVAKVPVAAA